MIKQNSLSYKIILRILVFTVGLGLIIFSIFYYYTRTTIEKSTKENAIFLAESTVNKIEEIIKPSEMIPDNLSWMMESGSIPKDSIHNFLRKLVKNNPSIYASAIAFEPNIVSNEKYYAPYAYHDQNEIKVTTLGSADYNYFIMDWYQIPAMLKEPYWSEPYYDDGGAGTMLSTFSTPFYLYKNEKRIFGGIITIDISLDWLTKIVNSVKIFDSGYAFLISQNGVFVTHPNHDFIMNESIFTLAKEKNTPILREIGRSMLKGESNLSSFEYDERGKVWIYYTQLPSTKWSIGVIYPHSEMYADLHHLTILIIILSIAGLGLLLFFTIRIINKLLSPLTKFSQSAHIIAEGNFNTELPEIESNDEMKELHDSFKFMQSELANYIVHLKETTSAKEKIESELRIAKEIQMGMIPHIFPPFPNMNEIDLFASLESAKEVGGDLYDFFLVDEHRLCFAIGDVSGKGIPASLFMAVTRTLLRSVADKNKSTSEIVSSINKTLAFNNESNMFVTFFLGILDVKSGALSYCNAGHNPPILIQHEKQTEYFKITKGIPLGLFEDFVFIEEQVQLSAKDQIFMYTDGLNEAENATHDLFGDDRLLKVIQDNCTKKPIDLIQKASDEVAFHVNGHIQSDDLTMMSIIYYGNSEK